ncbi:heterokaryon incompatibility protein-domain-containing protein [Xylaria arbuscula]|nr:heterokaryon incompatibility protein-domain-containing protein [Xylaria arbuscula]
MEPPPTYNQSRENEALCLNKRTESRYEYSALSYPDSIRVFILEPSVDETSRLDGKLVEHRLSDSCTELGYNALSYVWGEQKDTNVTHIEGRELRIGQNLDSALRHIRRKDRPIRIWVDALCIDQASVGERNHQVQQMRKIYSSATETIIYLGDMKGGNTELSAWNFLERRATWAVDDNLDADPDLPARREELTSFRGELADVGIEVLERPWFKRLWVFQEVVVSKLLSIQCGRRRIPWDDFCKVLLSPMHHDRYGFSVGLLRKADIVRDMFHARCSYQELQGMGHVVPYWWSEVQDDKHAALHVLDLLQMARTLEASDPRDKVFGLLGISNGINVDDQQFAIDYSQDDETVYTNFARSMINATRSLDVLSYIDHDLVQNFIHATRIRILPSWVPDWDLREWSDLGRRSARTVLDTLDLGYESKGGEHDPRNTKFCVWDRTGRILKARGSIIGRISQLSSMVELKRDAELRFQKIRDSDYPDEEKRQLIVSDWLQHIVSDSEDDKLELLTETFRECLDSRRSLEKGTVEYHLLSRARKTASWSNDSVSLRSAAVDRASIVDGRCIAIYESDADPEVRGLAIVPVTTERGDCLIDLRGGHVPFTIRETGDSDTEDDDESDAGDDNVSSAPRDHWDCRLIGEAVVNRVAGDTSTSREAIFEIH